MLRCLSPQQMQEFVTGGADALALEAGEAHLNACPSCRQQYLDLTKPQDADGWRAAALELPPPSPDDQALLDELKRLPEQAPAGRAGQAVDHSDWFHGDAEDVRDGSLGSVGRPQIGPHHSKLPDVPGFEIIGELGRGGMGVVYKARQPTHDRTVALKMILAGHQASTEDQGRFNDEAEAIARLRHPHIVQIFEVGQVEGRLYFVLEFVEGGTLSDKVCGRPMPSRSSAQLLESLARAMHYAHQRGIVHRDLKPANVLLHGRKAFLDMPEEEGRLALEWDFRRFMPKITDFGLAKLMDRSTGNGHTASGDVVGTPSYMAPEQAQGKPHAIGAATDVYSLGAILYEMLTGRPPFQGATPMDTLFQVHTQEPVPPRKVIRDVPQALEAICLKCLRKNPAQRYNSAEDLAEDLRLFLEGQPIQTRASPAWTGVGRKVGSWFISGLVFLVAVAAGAGLVALWLRGEQQDERLMRMREDSVAQARENVRLRLGNARATAERGEGGRAMWELAALLEDVDRRDDLKEFRDPVRLNLAAWARMTPALKWVSTDPVRAAASGGGQLFVLGADRRLLRDSGGWSLKPWDWPEAVGIRAFNLSADGSTIAAVTDAGTRWWETSGKLIASLPGLTNVRGLELSPDGKSLLVWVENEGGGLRLITRNGTEGTAQIEPIDSPANPVAWGWHPSGQLIVIASADGPVEMKRINSAGETRRVIRLPSPATAVAWLSDGSAAVLACADGRVRFWNSPEATTPEPPSFRAHPVGSVMVAAGSSGLILTAGSDRTAKLWRGDTGELVVAVPHPGGVTDVAFFSGGKTFLTRDAEGTARVWDVSTAGASSFSCKGIASTRPVISADDSVLMAVVNDSLRAGLWNLLRTDEAQGPYLVGGEDHRCGAFHPMGDLFLAGAQSLMRIQLHQLVPANPADVTRWTKSLSPDDGSVSFLACAPDGKTLLIGTEKGRAFTCDAESGERLGLTLTHPGPVNTASFRPGLKAVALGGGNSGLGGEARVWSLERSGEPLSPPLRHPRPIVTVEWEVDGKTLRTTDAGHHVRRWDFATGQRLDPPAPVAPDAMVAAYNAAGDRCLTVGTDGVARLLNASNHLELLESPAAAEFRGASFSPDRRLLMTAWSDGVRLWDAGTGAQIGPLLPLAGLTGGEFRGEGKKVFAWSASEARLWTLPQPELDGADEWRARLRRRLGLEANAEGLLRTLDGKEWNALSGAAKRGE